MHRVINARLARVMLAMAIPAVAICVVATWAGAANAPLHRLCSDFQDRTTLGVSEVTSTTLPVASPPGAPGTGGSHVYSCSVDNQFPVVYITFTATGDTHMNAAGFGAALLMSASVTNPTDGTKVCEAMRTGGLDPSAGPDGWITLQKLPSGTGGTNCNDGGGGDGDCHDNNLVFSCCVRVTQGSKPTTIDLRLASSNGGTVFYERANIQVDASPNPQGTLCRGVGLPADYAP